jgi:hypothetical protein
MLCDKQPTRALEAAAAAGCYGVHCDQDTGLGLAIWMYTAQPKPQCCQVTNLLYPCNTKEGMLEAALERPAAGVVARMLHPLWLFATLGFHCPGSVVHSSWQLFMHCYVSFVTGRWRTHVAVHAHWTVKNVRASVRRSLLHRSHCLHSYICTRPAPCCVPPAGSHPLNSAGCTHANVCISLQTCTCSLHACMHATVYPLCLHTTAGCFTASAGSHPSDDHWAVRREAAALLSTIARYFAAPHHNLQPRLCRVLAQALLDADKPLTSKYGAVVGLQVRACNHLTRHQLAQPGECCDIVMATRQPSTSIH